MYIVLIFFNMRGWSGGAMVLGKFLVRGFLLIWIRVGQRPTALAVCAGGGCLDTFSLVCHFAFLSSSLWETARYRLKYCLKGPFSPKQPTNQILQHEGILCNLIRIASIMSTHNIPFLNIRKKIILNYSKSATTEFGPRDPRTSSKQP